ncbi:MAG: histidine kinase [Clostridiales bacterium GWB2_37_7]|nr:MAG: histidine kinase [Clostridiales bacterium GWB2_37_7]
MRKLLNRRTIVYTVLIILVLLLILVQMAYRIYKDNRDTIINQQLQQLLTISKSISRSLEVFANEKMDSLKILALNNEFGLNVKNENKPSVQAALEAFINAQEKDIQRVYQINKTGQSIYQYPTMDAEAATENNSMLKSDIERVLREKTSFISRAQKDSRGQFTIYLFEPVFFNGEFEGIVAASVSLETMYKKLAMPVKAGQKGYAMVKDDKGIILMHPVKEQIGMDVIKTRKELFPDFDFRELEKLIQQQYSNEEGTVEYYSYWWTEQELEKSKKLNAFSRAYIGDYFWVVAMTMDYNEVEGPLRQNLIKTIDIFLIIIIILASAIFIILKIQKNKEALEVETKYLKELNSAMEELRKKEQQLQHSQKLQVVGTLTGGIAHEFNNLLTPILGYSEILKNKLNKGSDAYDYVNEIYEVSHKAKDMIEQILVFSRSDNGISKYKPIQVKQIVEETLNLVKSAITRNVVVDYEEKSDGSCIMANRVQIHQVIFNLCTNAFHAMKYTGGTLTVMLDTASKEDVREFSKQTDNAEAYVCITVSDTGYGMSKETMEKIFDPFFTTKPTGEGTGLGLFVVQGIVENHKGFITVESENGKGSTFKVYFPQIHSKPEKQGHEGFTGLKSAKSVLLVDDEQKVLNVMKKGLEYYGFKVVAESNSIEALKIFSHNPDRFDAVILDQTMPYIKGTELAERLKMIHPRIKIIVVTGFADDKVLEYMDNMIIDEYVNKPVTGEQLARAIGRILEND